MQGNASQFSISSSFTVWSMYSKI